jgi:hypothetical protein
MFMTTINHLRGSCRGSTALLVVLGTYRRRRRRCLLDPGGLHYAHPTAPFLDSQVGDTIPSGPVPPTEEGGHDEGITESTKVPVEGETTGAAQGKTN